MSLDLPKGKVSIEVNGVEGNANGHGLIVQAGGNKEVLLDSDSLPDVVAKHGDSALLRVYTGGNACPAMYTWLTYDKKGLRATDQFGTCAEDGDLIQRKGYPSFVLEGIGESTDRVQFDFDGEKVSEKKLAPAKP
ncbi:hypothetical protein G6M04_30235 [Agrobacterium rhizogenes]|uniref:hypothetical protein n=1 Tax=Rhizobium rhizogenes TaxID=359 RepID=UPI001573A9E2|nr:hypothetical protein [Rhizobium rhizogenes]NTG51679.1 hypothetical protein [Rhizobium rhizogenes]